MKKNALMCFSALAMAFSAAAGVVAYDDLGGRGGTETEFWDTSRHAAVQTYEESSTIAFGLDTWYETTAADEAEVDFTGVGLAIVFR